MQHLPMAEAQIVTAEKISSWVEIPQVLTIATSGGDCGSGLREYCTTSGQSRRGVFPACDVAGHGDLEVLLRRMARLILHDEVVPAAAGEEQVHRWGERIVWIVVGLLLLAAGALLALRRRNKSKGI